MRIDKNTTIRLGDRNIIKIKIGDSVIWEKKTVVDETDYFYIESLGDGNTISVINVGDLGTTNVTPTLEYSTDKNTWNTITFNWKSGTHTTNLPILNTGEKMYFRNDTRLFSNSYSKYISFSPSVQSNVGGDIRTLSNYLDVDNETTPQIDMFERLFYNNKFIVDASNLRLPYTTLADYCYNSMFLGCTSLTSAPTELLATTLAISCYNYMFSGCTSLTTTPTLPATTLANYCYRSMFQDCTSLTTTPTLPATTLASGCYRSMFQGCTSLTTVPTILPATALASECYSSMFQGCTGLTSAPELPATDLAFDCYRDMFNGCSSLVNAPELPATALGSGCYKNMFNGCSSLVNAPELPATALGSDCYQNMFNGCSSLTTAPELPATTLESQCYDKMFYGCSKLTIAPTLPATTLAFGCYRDMFNGCSSLVNAPELPATTLTNYCYQKMFSGCTSLQTTPTLPATTLASGCYSRMFNGCTGLTSAPELPATTLASECYSIMFNGCSKLTIAPTLPATTLVDYCYYQMFYNCSLINEITVYADDISATNCTNNWLSGVASSGTFNNMGFAPFETGASGIPTGWTEITPEIQSITANPDTFTIKSYKDTANCTSTLTITTTTGITTTHTNSATITVGENTGDTTRTIVETIPYKSSSYQVTIVQTANDVKPLISWNVVSEGTYPFQLNSNGYYESTNKRKSSSYSYATLNYSGFENLVLECINSGESNYDYGIISQPDVQLSESTTDDGTSGSETVFKNFKGQSSTNPVQLTIPSNGESHFITIKYIKDSSGDNGNDSLQFKVIEP